MTEVLEQQIVKGRILERPHDLEGIEQPASISPGFDGIDGFSSGLRRVAAQREAFPELNEKFIYARVCGPHIFTATTDRLRIRSAIGSELPGEGQPIIYDNAAEITFEGEINRCAVSNDGRTLAVSIGEVLSLYSVKDDSGKVRLSPIASYPFADFDVEGGNISFSEDNTELRAYTRTGVKGRFPAVVQSQPSTTQAA